ncbi:MAG: hypothetical protein HQ541_21760 [Mariniphaga sp.]|nr:hypothetical protein [Mariniphaga sp.]
MSLSEFDHYVSKGELYEYLSAKYNGNISRDDAKEIVFKVLFSQNEIYKNYIKTVPYKKEKQVFEFVFPFVSDSITILKSRDYKKLSNLLTKIESHIFIDCISKKLVNAGIIPKTIHDSVIIKQEHQEQALSIIKKVFDDKFKVTPSLHIKKLNQN